MYESLDQVGRSALHYAVVDGNVREVAALIRAGAEVNRPDNAGWTPLHFAAEYQALDIAKSLIGAGANIDAYDQHGNTPLFRGVMSSAGEGDLIRLLLDNGADPFAKNKHGISPIELARQIGNYDVAQFFRHLE